MKSQQYSLEEMIDGLKSEKYQGLASAYKYKLAIKSLLILCILSPLVFLQINDTRYADDHLSLLLIDAEADFEIFEEDLLLLEEIL